MFAGKYERSLCDSVAKSILNLQGDVSLTYFFFVQGNSFGEDLLEVRLRGHSVVCPCSYRD